MSAPLRVLQVGMSPYYGGTESFVMNQYRKINRDAVQFDFLNVFNEPIACEDEIKALGGRIYPLNMSRRHGVRQYKKHLNAFFREHADKFDIIHCNFQSLINIDLLKYAKKYNIRGRVAHAHNAGYGKEPNFLQKCIIAWNKRRLSKYASSYFACSSLAGRWMFGHERSIVIHNAIDASRFLYNEDVCRQTRARCGLTNEKMILFVGRLDPQKNPLFLLDIFHEIVKKDENYRLFVVGDGILRADMETKIAELSLLEHVRMLGSRSDVNELMQAADCFLLPSRFEGLGIVLIEAQAASLRCFTSRDVVPAEVDITGLVTFLPLHAEATCWADEILTSGNTKRVSQMAAIIQGGYDAVGAVQLLEKEYMGLCEIK